MLWRYSRVLHVLSGETAGNLAPLWWEPDAFFTVLTCDSRTNSHSFSSTSCTSPRSTWNVGAFTPCQDDPKLLNSDSQQGRQAMYISDWKMYDICQKGYWQHIQHASTCSLYRGSGACAFPKSCSWGPISTIADLRLLHSSKQDLH